MLRDRAIFRCLLTFSAASSAALANISVTATSLAPSDGFDRYSIVAINDGLNTGTLLKALEYEFVGTKAFFQVDDTPDDQGASNGIPDTVNFQSAGRTRVRLSNNAANLVHLSAPSLEAIEPNPFTGGASYFAGAIANLGSTPATGSGYEIARIYLAPGGGGRFTGKIGGNSGPAQAFVLSLGTLPSSPHLPLMDPVPQVEARWFPNLQQGAPFSFEVRATDEDSNDILTLTVGPTASTIGNVRVTRSESNPDVFTVTGTISWNGSGSLVRFSNIKVSVDDGQGSVTNQTVRIRVSPEPVSIAFFAGVIAVGRRR